MCLNNYTKRTSLIDILSFSIFFIILLFILIGKLENTLKLLKELAQERVHWTYTCGAKRQSKKRESTCQYFLVEDEKG